MDEGVLGTGTGRHLIPNNNLEGAGHNRGSKGPCYMDPVSNSVAGSVDLRSGCLFCQCPACARTAAHPAGLGQTTSHPVASWTGGAASHPHDPNTGSVTHGSHPGLWKTSTHRVCPGLQRKRPRVCWSCSTRSGAPAGESWRWTWTRAGR